MLEYAVSGDKGGVWDLLDTTKAGDPDFVGLEANPQSNAPMAQDPGMPSETAGLPREEGDRSQPTGGWDAVREGWETEGPEAMWNLLCLLQTGPTTILSVLVLFHLPQGQFKTKGKCRT